MRCGLQDANPSDRRQCVLPRALLRTLLATTNPHWNARVSSKRTITGSTASPSGTANDPEGGKKSCCTSTINSAVCILALVVVVLLQVDPARWRRIHISVIT